MRRLRTALSDLIYRLATALDALGYRVRPAKRCGPADCQPWQTLTVTTADMDSVEPIMWHSIPGATDLTGPPS